MDTLVEDHDVLFPSVFAHLTQLQQQPTTTALDSELLRRAERALSYSSPQALLFRLLQTGESLLEQTPSPFTSQDPRPLVILLTHVISLLPFSTLQPLITPTKLLDGLSSPSPPIQLLILAYLTRASTTPSGAASIAASSPLVQQLLTTWLASESTEVSESALETLIALLTVDSPTNTTFITSTSTPSTPSTANTTQGSARGQGLLWRRLFHDPDAYSLFFRFTTLTHPQSSFYNLATKKGQQQTTISQARLFDFLARVAVLDWTSISTSSLPDVERTFVRPKTGGGEEREERGERPYGGLLRYAAAEMIDGGDYLMEVLRREFFVRLLSVVRDEEEVGGRRRVPPRLLESIQKEAGVEGGEEQGLRV